MISVQEIKESIRQNRDYLEQEYKVESIALFGSYARGHQNTESDIDILVEFYEPVSLIHIVSLENYLSDLLTVKVDLVVKKTLRKEIESFVLREAIPI